MRRVVAVAVVGRALAIWKLKIVIALVFLGLIIAAAMRPGVDWLARHRVPFPLGVALHYLAIAGAISLMLRVAVPRALDQVNQATGGVPTSQQELKQKANHPTGIKHQFFVGLQKHLKSSRPPAPSSTVRRRSGRARRHLGGFYVLMAVSFVAVLATLLDVIVRDKDPAGEEVPAVLFPNPKESPG